MVPHTMTSPQPIIHGVMASFRNTVPYSSANTGARNVTAKARLGPAWAVSYPHLTLPTILLV